MTAERTELGREIETALGEVLAHVRGETQLPCRIVDDPAAGRIVALRKRFRLSRQKFADRFGLDVRALQEWEQGRRVPDRAARVLLTVIDRDPRGRGQGARRGWRRRTGGSFPCVSARSLVSAIQMSCRCPLALAWRDLGNLFRTLPVLCSQQRCSRVVPWLSRKAFQKPSAPSPTASSGATSRPRRLRSSSSSRHDWALSR